MTEAYICDSAHADRPLRRRARERARRRPRRHPDQGARRRNPDVDWRDSTTSSSAAPTRPARTTATSRAWRCCSPACRTACRARPSTACAAPASTRSARGARDPVGEADLMIAGGVESMSRAPFVMPKADERLRAQRRDLRHDHRLALRQSADGGAVRLDSMGETAENVAERVPDLARRPGRVRAAQSQKRAAAAQKRGRFAAEIVAGRRCRRRKGEPVVGRTRRASARRDTLEALAQAADAVPQGRHGDGGQRLGRQRRRLRRSSSRPRRPRSATA